MMSSIMRLDEGDAERLLLGINGTMEDAQKIVHPYLSSTQGRWCRICGLSVAYEQHWANYSRES